MKNFKTLLAISITISILLGAWLFIGANSGISIAEAKVNSDSTNVYTDKCSGSILYDGQEYNLIEKNKLCWLDRNLGADSVCAFHSDRSCFGDLYQWGRDNDGHQDRNSKVIQRLSSSIEPEHEHFISSNIHPFDWSKYQNNDLWDLNQNTVINNPCPDGFRVPTIYELYKEARTWKMANTRGAFGSTLRWASSGNRNAGTGEINGAGYYGTVWSSEEHGTKASAMYWSPGMALEYNEVRATGMPVRCVR